MIASLIAALREVGLDPTAEEVADVIWLACHARLGRPPADPNAGAATTTPRAADGDPQLPTQPQERPSPGGREGPPPDSGPEAPEAEPSGGLYTWPSGGGRTAGSLGGIPFRSPGGRALPGTLELARALRPLMRRVGSRTSRVLDEEATINRVAEEGIWSPVSRPALTRWLEVALVIDEGASMRVWKETVREFTRLLELQGAFRDVRTWRLNTDSGGGQVALRVGTSALPRSPTELIDPSGRRVIVVITDCVSPGWEGGHLARVLAEWGRHHPVAILQMLPQRLWAQTALYSAPAVRVRSSRPGQPNAQLSKELGRRSRGASEVVPVPVFTLEPTPAATWARLVAGTGGARAPAFLLEPVRRPLLRPPRQATPAEPTPEELLKRFRARVSPTAFELARLLAAAPLTLPVMRLVQRVMLPESRQVNLAEVFLGGILRPAGADAGDADKALYDFLPGLRESLLNSAPVPDSVAVIKVVSKYLGERVGQALDFNAILADPHAAGELVVDESDREFARVGAEVLRRLGGRYSAVADRITGVSGAGPELKPEPELSEEGGVAALIEEALRSGADSLDLSYLSMAEVPEQLLKLRSLRELNLSHNRLRKLPPNIGLLADLRVLDVSHNQLNSASALWELRRLEELHLTHNMLTTAPSRLGRLKHLRHLCLNHNRLKRLPARLGELERLEQLELSGNELSSLPESLGRLAGLRELRLNSNQLSSLPESLRGLNLLERLYLQENEALEIPPELLGPDPDAVHFGLADPASPRQILDYYFDRSRPALPFREAKVVLVGNGGTGKTAIVNRLIEDYFRRDETRTRGLQILKSQVTVGEGVPVRLSLWDFGGQEVYHSVTRLFFTKHSLYLLVCSSREGTDADYWLRLIGSLADEPPVIVILNKSEDYPFDLDQEALRRKYPFIREFIRTDCASGLGIEQLRQSITLEVGRIEHLGRPLPRSWFAVKNRLAETMADYISQRSFRYLCADNGLTDDALQNSLGEYLHDLGHILWFRGVPSLQDICVLNPGWLAEAVSSVIDYAGRTGQRGLFRLSELKEVLTPAHYPEDTHRFLLDLMARFDLCLSFPQDPEQYLIPKQLDLVSPVEVSEFNPEECLNFRYQYEVMPLMLLPRFILRTDSLSEGLPRWRAGVILESEGCRALVTVDVQKKLVSINIKGHAPARRRLLVTICQQFELIHMNLVSSRVLELVPLPGHPEAAVPYDELLAREKAGIATFPVVVEGKVIELGVSTLLDGPEPEDERRAEADRASLTSGVEKDPRTLVYLSYSYEDWQFAEELRKHLELLWRTNQIEIWADTLLKTGDDWEETTKEAIGRAGIILMLVSPDYLASDFIRNVEMPEALRMREAGKAQVIPVIIRDCVWERTPLGDLQALPKGGRPVNNFSNLDAVFKDITQAIRNEVVKRLPGSPPTPAWRPAPGIQSRLQLPVLKITLLGDTGVGKTVFASSMYARLRDGSEGVAIRAINSEVDLELDWTIGSLYESNRWPPATQGEEKPYEFELLLRGKPVGRIDLMLYGAEGMLLGQGLGREESLINRLRESNSIFWLIDMSQINQDAAGTLSARLTTKVGRVLQLLRQAVAGEHSIRSILYVGTKSDVVTGKGGEPDWNLARDRLVEHIGPARLGEVPYSAAIPVSSVGRTTAGGLHLIGDDPYNVEWPLLLALAFMLKIDLKELDQTARAAHEALIQAKPHWAVQFLKDAVGWGMNEQEMHATEDLGQVAQRLIDMREVIQQLLKDCPESIRIFERK